MEIITKGGNVITCTPEEYAKMVQLGVMPGSGSGTPGTPPWAAPGSSPDTTAQHPEVPRTPPRSTRIYPGRPGRTRKFPGKYCSNTGISRSYRTTSASGISRSSRTTSYLCRKAAPRGRRPSRWNHTAPSRNYRMEPRRLSQPTATPASRASASNTATSWTT